VFYIDIGMLVVPATAAYVFGAPWLFILWLTTDGWSLLSLHYIVLAFGTGVGLLALWSMAISYFLAISRNRPLNVSKRMTFGVIVGILVSTYWIAMFGFAIPERDAMFFLVIFFFLAPILSAFHLLYVVRSAPQPRDLPG